MSLLTSPATILVTGATSGIGASLARQLVAQGHRIIAVSRTAASMSDATAAYSCDLSQPVAVIALCEQIRARHPDISVVINNAAVQHAVGLEVSTVEQLVGEAMLNLVAPALIARAFVGPFRARDAPTAIINIGSGLAYFPKEATTLYRATKAGLHSLSITLRYQCEGSRLLICEAILPLVATAMTEGRGRGKLSADQAARAIIAGVRAGRREVFVGKARLLPFVQQLAPWLGRRMLRHG